MADTTDILRRLLNTVEEIRETQQEQGNAITAIQATQQEQGNDIKSLKTDVSALKKGQETLELKVELINANQQRAEEQSQKDHAEIMTHMVDMIEIEGNEHKLLERRVARIEKHSNLLPLK